ncbi:ZN383 protein, partial [Horornis vulcanius]|nr:ZN383 protein [Horornis vulcanius]
ETFRWTVVQQIRPGTSRKSPKKPQRAELPNFQNIIVLQKSYECPECGKSFSCSSHFSKHRRTHTG